MRLITITTLALTLTAAAQHSLWYEKPAKNWNEALPVGNGRMGAMVFGDPQTDRIQLNEDSLWPMGEPKRLVKGTPADLAHARKLIDEGKLAEATKFVPKTFSFQSIVKSHQTLGDLHIHWKNTGGKYTDYRRDLDLKTGLATATWKRDNTTYTQEVFCSNPAEGLFIKLTAEGPATINLDLDLTRPVDKDTTTHKTSSEGKTLTMSGQITQRNGQSDGKAPNMKGVKFHTTLVADHQGGKISATDNKLQIRDAKSVTLRLTATSSFWTEDQQAKNTRSTKEPADYDAIKTAHIADHQALYNRCILTLSGDPERDKLPFNQRLQKLSKDSADPTLEALIFHYGRYLLIASSRPNGNPANLQGLWNEHIQAPWNSDYHLNINLQMNYWPANVTNLAETHLPLFNWMESLAKNGAVTAKQQYGMRGWMSHHATDLEANTGHIASQAHWGSWIHGGGWMSQHLWTHYAYTQDKAFLRETAYPLLAGHSRFYLDWLVEKDGKLISSFESSPENSFITTDGKRAAICEKAAMGQQIITELLTNTLAAAKELGINDELTKEIATALPKIDTGLHIGPDGRILEWDKPYKEAEPGHRHLSHLYAFHPGNTITHEDTPDLLTAAKKSIMLREKHGSVGIGWSRSWAVSIYARLRDGNTAHKHLHEMLRTQTITNGFNSVYGKNRPVFQIEANLGATAGVAEMLIQSHGGNIHLLPALPKAWSTGSITGLKARGGHTIDLTWKDGKLTAATITKGPTPLPPLLLAGKQIVKTDSRITIQ